MGVSEEGHSVADGYSSDLPCLGSCCSGEAAGSPFPSLCSSTPTAAQWTTLLVGAKDRVWLILYMSQKKPKPRVSLARPLLFWICSFTILLCAPWIYLLVFSLHICFWVVLFYLFGVVFVVVVGLGVLFFFFFVIVGVFFVWFVLFCFVLVVVVVFGFFCLGCFLAFFLSGVLFGWVFQVFSLMKNVFQL